jgi:hypothetical protein
MKSLKPLAVALCATLALAAATEARAIGDIRLVNLSAENVHPYFKSNCWAPFFTPAQPGEWVFFGTVLSGTQFTWDHFYGLLDPKCKNPVIKVTFNLDGEAPPQETDVDRTVLLQYDATENHRIVLGNRIVVVEDAAE